MTAHVATVRPANLAPAGVPDPVWIALSQALTDEAPLIADRDDLIVRIAPGAGFGAPACFLPELAVIEVDGVHLGQVDPATATPHRATDRARYAPAWGLLVHECAHARHSGWDVPPGTPSAVGAAAELLDESRIERAQVQRRPDDRHWLRSAVTQLVLADCPVLDPARAGTLTASHAAHAAALILARADAGILTPAEVEQVNRAVRDILGSDKLDELRAVWSAAHITDDRDAEGMINLGRRWCDILGVGHNAPAAAVQPGGSGPAGGAGIGTARNPGADGTPDPLAQAVGALVVRISDALATESAPGAESATSAPCGNGQASRPRPTRMVAASVFGGAVSVTGRFAVTGTRLPTDSERRAARQIGTALTTAGHQDRAMARTTSALPPGRLRMRGALAADAQRAAGAVPTAEPFTRITRAVVPEPPLRVGIACDVSRSMAPFTGPVASAAWIFASAARHTRIPTTTATVIFGRTVHPIGRPGTAPDRVTVFEAPEGRHAVDEAVDALDGALDLSGAGAARLLVIVSDGIYELARRRAGMARVTALRAAGCGVLWLAPGDASATPFDGTTVVTLTDPAATATTIARAATAALRSAARAAAV